MVNGENAADGIGITPRLADQLLGMGVDAITLGNHAFRRTEIGPYLEASDRVIRPANTSRSTPGRGLVVVPTANGTRLAVINVLGSLFLHPATSMFEVIDELVEEARKETPVVLVDVHAEATSEKAAMGRWLDGRVTAVVGTHTHVQTSDATVLPKGTAFITDAGMTGPHDSVIGVEAELAIRRMRTGLPVRFETAQGGVRIEGAVVECDAATGKASVDRGAPRSRLLIASLRKEQPQEDERDDPREVEVEPVGQRELEGDEHGGGERGQLERALAPRHDRDEPRECDREDDDDGLKEPEVGNPARVVLTPAPDRERRVAPGLEPDGAFPERASRLPQRRLEEQDRERERARDDERRREAEHAA